MKLKVATDNGNVAALNRIQIAHNHFNNISWHSSNNPLNVNNTTRIDNSQYNTNYKVYDSSDSVQSDSFTFNGFNKEISTDTNAVCNQQYRLNAKANINSELYTQPANLGESTETTFVSGETFLENADVSSSATPVDEDRTFEHSDTDEMSEHSIHSVPRGIINPNYPGFQHLAHTLQDYSANIENFYHSENDMTDDDIDLETTESYESTYNLSSVDCESLNNNNGNNINYQQPPDKTTSIQFIPRNEELDSQLPNEIPDLLKTISKNNNNIKSPDYEINCTDADIENNFHAKDIIGDFNKEIEDEIKQLLNYNINIQEDLEELRKDIKETFAKPIENTINNISDVVNHVIKKLVETQCDSLDQTDGDTSATLDTTTLTVQDVNIDNQTNTKTEMNLSRPTFLLLENRTAEKITDAFLSDGKDEINVQYENEYDMEALSNNVEQTIQQLSTELRKIIPKLDEMRECDRIWNDSKIESAAMLTDGNSNEIASCSKLYTATTAVDCKPDISKNSLLFDTDTTVRTHQTVARIEPRTVRSKQQKENVSTKFRSAQNNSSVRKSESTRECDIESFDVYNIETALPKLDLDAIESHLKAAKEAERRKHNDREEIRRRLATGIDSEEYYSMGHIERPGRKPSLHSRLQSGKNLQICFMNETASDNESQASDVERNLNYSTKSLSRSSIFSKSNFNHPYQTRPLSINITKSDKISTLQSGTKLRPTSFTSKTQKSRSALTLANVDLKDADFQTVQATLQTRARIALAQAKEMASIQMERERRARAESPVTAMLRRSMEKANVPLAPDRRRVSRQLLTDMNIAQLQVIVNELHSQIESLNEQLVKMLMARDELHMGQDSMLVDIEDLTRYLGVKEQTKKTKGTGKSGVRRLASLVHK